MKRRNVFFVMIMLLIMCLTGCGDSVENDSFSEDKVNENIENEEISTQEYMDNLLPYLPMSNDYRIGEDFEDYKKTPTDWAVSLDGSGWSSNYYLVDDDTISYYAEIDHNNYYLGVADGAIVAVIKPAGTSTTYVKEVLNVDGEDLCEPYILNLQQNVSHYFWRIYDGYLAIRVMDISDNYLENVIIDVVYVADSKYFSLLNALVESNIGNNSESEEDNGENDEFYSNEQDDYVNNEETEIDTIKEAVNNVHISMTELQNGGQDVLFDNASLWAIANNWEELKNNPVAGQPVDCITYEDRIEFVYGNGLTLIWHYNEDIIDVVDTNTNVDNSAVEGNTEVSDDDIYLAVINTYYGLSNYMNGNDLVVFDTEALRIIAENYDIVKELDLFEAPMDVQEYDAMRSGPTVRFDYDAGVSIIWTKDTDEVEITYDEE